jgi:hypothetical protein
MSNQSKGHTALASYLALQAAKKATNPRKALLVISDGGDNSSRYTEEEVKYLVKETDGRTYIRHQYAFGYTPSRQARDWKYRRVSVKVIQPRGITMLCIFRIAGIKRLNKGIRQRGGWIAMLGQQGKPEWKFLVRSDQARITERYCHPGIPV